MEQRHRNWDNKSSVVEIDLQIIVNKYSEQVKQLETLIAKNPHNLTAWSTWVLATDIRLVIDLLISQSLMGNHYFKQLEVLRDRGDAIEAKLRKAKGN